MSYVDGFLAAVQSFHYELGKQLRILRDQGVMIMGSGNIVHNLREIAWGDDAKPHSWAIEFDEWSKKRLLIEILTL